MYNEPIHEEEYKGLTIKIIHDDDPGMNPVEDWDMMGKQMYWHSRMNLGNGYKETNKYTAQEWLERELDGDLYTEWEDNYSGTMGYFPFLMQQFSEKNLVIPVHAYEHGGITISATGGLAGWDSFDSGQLGFVYVSHEDILKEYSRKKMSKKLLDRAEKCLIAEVEEYDNYLTGNVWGYKIEDENGEDLDSCWGFFGDYKYCLDEAKSSADYLAEQKEKEMKELD